MQEAKIKKGDKVLVLGAGPIGQLCSLAARVYGADFIVATDIKEGRLSTVKQFGVDKTLNTNSMDPEKAGTQAAKLFEGGIVDVVVDGVGQELSIRVNTRFFQLCCLCVRVIANVVVTPLDRNVAIKPGGTVLIAGVAKMEVMMPLSKG